MPIYIGDYMKDTGHLSVEEHGFYFLALMHLWNNEGYSTKEKFRGCLKFSEKKMEKFWKKTEEFFQWREEKFFQKRLLFEIEKSAKNRQSKSKAGKMSAKARWEKVTPVITPVVTAVQQSGNPSPSPSPIEKKLPTVVKKRTKKFTPPTILEVQEYCKSRKNKVDAVEFFYHYKANNWFRGKTKIASWKACVITWEKSQKNGGKSNAVKSFAQQSDDNYREIKESFHNGAVHQAGENQEELDGYLPPSQRAIEPGESDGPDSHLDGRPDDGGYELSGELLQISQEEQSSQENSEPQDGAGLF